MSFFSAWQVNASTSSSSSCPSPASSHLPAPSVAPGYESRLIASGLTAPRGLIFDSAGHLLVVEQGKGVTALTLKDNGGSCLSVSQRSTVVSDSSVSFSPLAYPHCIVLNECLVESWNHLVS